MSRTGPDDAAVLLPLPGGEQGRVLLYGGVFDPVHRAHVELGIAAREAVFGAEGDGAGAGWLVFVPAAASPFKVGGPAASDEDRVAMLRLAIEGVERAGVWMEEIERGREARGPSYWVDTLRVARRQVGDGADLRFLIGADQAAQFHRWREFREILRLARPVVMLRRPIASVDDLAAALRGARDGEGRAVWDEGEVEAWLGWVVDVPLRDDSSTEVRELLSRRGEAGAIARLRELVPERVLEYIMARPGLYAVSS